MKNTFFLNYKDYLTKLYGEPAYRIGVDGGFSCPNRGPDRTQPGCSFCAEEGSRSPYTTGAEDLETQISKGTSFLAERYGAKIFLLYFQAFSSTWAPVEKLRALYDRGLACAPFRELIVSTRPDCITPGVADLLASYRQKGLDVWCELGLQSCHDETLKRTNRGHTSQDYADAAALLNSRGIKVAPHLIYGLPGETLDDFLATVQFAVDQGLAGIKFHQLLIPPGTALYQDWQAGRILPVDPKAYLEALVRGLELLPPETVILRINADYSGREDDLPGEQWPKNLLFNRLVQDMQRRGTKQGRLYKKL